MKNILKGFIKWLKIHIYEILYIILLLILSTYILVNWEKCITMKFFEQFNGNNILFLIWIMLFILPFYDIEAKGWKLRRKRTEDARREFEYAERDFMQNQINDIRNNIGFENSEEMDGGSSDHE